MGRKTKSALDAPGMKERRRADGTSSFYWIASAVSRNAADYPQKTVRLHGDTDEMAQLCRTLTADLRSWLSDSRKGPRPIYEGCINSLVAVYRKTPESPYNTKIKHSTRRMYDESLDLLEKAVGARRLSKLTGLDFSRWYAEIKKPAGDGAPERVRRAYKAMQLLRIIVKFGVVSGIEDCFRLATILENMEFSAPPARLGQITFAQAEAICEHAIATGYLSIAIAQALQFELTLRQIDVIGEWEPAEKGASGIMDRGQRWSGGVLWSHLGRDGILRKVTTKTGAEAEHDTTAYPFLVSTLDRVSSEKRIGPMVVCETTGLPYRQRHFIDVWRLIADKVGVPRDVWNRDSRAGGVTEGSDAGADIEHLRHHATHANIATTGRYNRRTVKKTRKVAELRVAHRLKQSSEAPTASIGINSIYLSYT